MNDKANQEAPQEAEAETLFAIGVRGLPDEFFEEAIKEKARLESRLCRIERALGLPEEA